MVVAKKKYTMKILQSQTETKLVPIEHSYDIEIPTRQFFIEVVQLQLCVVFEKFDSERAGWAETYMTEV